MNTPVEPDDAASLVRDITRESWNSFTAMSRWSQITLIAGMVVHVAAVLPPLNAVLHPAIGWIRVAAFVAIVV